MANLGRIRKSTKKRTKAYRKHGFGTRKGPTIVTEVLRQGGKGNSSSYSVDACIRTKHMAERNCGEGSGRTVQSALAKALKHLTGKIARRGRRR